MKREITTGALCFLLGAAMASAIIFGLQNINTMGTFIEIMTRGIVQEELKGIPAVDE